MRVGLWRSWAPKIWCFWAMVLEKTLESALDCKEIRSVHSEGDLPWISLDGMMLNLKLQYFGHLMRSVYWLEKLWCWDELGAGREGDDRGWDGWMASLTLCMWVWVNSGSWWWTGRPCMLQFMGLQRVRHEWETKLYWKSTLFICTDKEFIAVNLKSISLLKINISSNFNMANVHRHSQWWIWMGLHRTAWDNCALISPIICSVTFCWYLEIECGRSIRPLEVRP